MTRTLAVTICIAAVAATALPSDALAGASVTGTEGRDEVKVTAVSSRRAVITGAAGVVGEGCFPVSDTLVNRTTAFNCPIADPWTVSLGGGDDVLTADLRNPDVLSGSLTADGGAGADVLSVQSPMGRTLRGGDGDDVLAAPRAPRDAGEAGALLDGGNGRDQVDYTDALGVNASLPGKSATVRTLVPRDPETGQASGVTRTRTDSLGALERVAGSNEPDILTGGPGPEELLGQGGTDDLIAAGGDDVIDGGTEPDVVDGGDGADQLNGGPGRDTFRKGSGFDTIISRDGFTEDIACVKDDTIVSDLVDKLSSPEQCKSVSVAAAKHAFDTQLLGLSGARARIACPAEKTEACSGTLRLRLGGNRGSVLARVSYRVRQGAAKKLALPLSQRTLARIRGRTVTLQAGETDDDRRPRSILRRLRVAR